MRVVAGFIELDNFVLLCQRHRNSKRFPLKWEFPGGKVEDNEIPEEAIRRELYEELGIVVGSISLIDEYLYSYHDEAEFNLYFFRIASFENTIQNLEFERIAWVRTEELFRYDLLEGDLPFLKHLGLSVKGG